MTNKALTKIFFIVIIAVVLIFFTPILSNAASFSVSAGKTTMTTGETTSLTVTANGCGGKFTITSSDSSVVAVAESLVWSENSSDSVTINGVKAGTAKISVTPTSVADSNSGDELSLAAQSVTITVKDPVTTNNNQGLGDASLKSITVAGKVYSNPKTDMTVTVDAKLDSAEVTAVANASDSKITGTGVKELKTGTNSVTLTVTSARRSKKDI